MTAGPLIELGTSLERRPPPVSTSTRKYFLRTAQLWKSCRVCGGQRGRTL